MKRTNNILFYLWLLLLIVVTACTDDGREVASINQQMQESDEVELSIRTQIPEMEVGSRAATESITSITAFAFSDESILIKKVDALLSNPTDTTGTLKIKVPKRTRSIHFVAKNGDSYDAGNYTLGETTLDELLLNKTTTDLHYWGMLTFANAEALNVNNLSLTLYRNMAKVVLTSKVGEENDYIAGFLNYNGNATLIPHDANGTLGYQANAVTLPEDKGVASHDSSQNLGTEYFLSEHANEEGKRLYAICYIGGKYYKIAFSNSNGVFFPLVRNHLYRIVINQISGGSDIYEAAKNAAPINGSVKEETMNVTTVPIISYKGNSSEVTVTIPNGVTSLRVTTLPEQFVISSTEVTLTDNVCDVTGKQSVNFTLTLKDDYIGTTGTPNISFSGSGPSVSATGTGTVTLNGFMDMYEMYVDNSNLNGSTEYAKFFHTRTNTNVNNKSLTTEYVDAGVNGSTLAHNHNTAAINMVNESAISFTIADTRYLTLLVARSNDALSINLLKDSLAWTATSDKAKLPTYYNFSKDGDITTSGRLIRYTLEPGTYTLQRGNNDYLLYYMRVTKEKPTMTDIVQPTAADYSLSWSDNTKERFFKESDTKYFVDEEATTFTPTLTFQGLSDSPLTTTSLTVVTDTLYFKDNAQDVSGTTIIMKSDTISYNGNNPTLLFNAGTYNNLCGTIENVAETDYKYAAFYDNIQLKEVSGIEVKNTIKVGLYNSWEGNAAEIDEYAIGGPYLIGFKMPQNTLPVTITEGENGTVTPINFTISSDWVRKHSGLGVQYDGNGGYQLTTQSETDGGQIMRAHPRPEWTYKIEWSGIPENTKVISPSTTDPDVYFSYKGTIAKQVDISTGLEGQTFDIELDFYTETEGANGGTGQYTNSNLVFGETNFYLKATISKNVPAGTTIVLNKRIEGDVNAVHQYYSHYQSDGITNSWNNEMSFTTVAGKTEYLTCWKFVRSDNRNTNDVNISYTLTSNDESVYKLSGETIANITIKGNHSKQILVAMDNVNNDTATERIEMPFEYTKGGNDQLTVTVTVPDGVGELNIEANDFNVSWTDADAAGNTSGNTYKFANSTGERIQKFIFTLKEGSKTPKDESLINFAYAADRWTVAPGVVDLELSEKVVDDGVVFEYNFDSLPTNIGYNGGNCDAPDGSLIFTATSAGGEDYSNQIVLNGISFEQNAVYSLTFKVKSNVTDSTENGLSIGFDNPDDSFNWCGTFTNNGTSLKLVESNNFTEVSLTATATATVTNGRLFFNLGHLGACTIYIDDLKLVKNN